MSVHVCIIHTCVQVQYIVYTHADLCKCVLWLQPCVYTYVECVTNMNLNVDMYDAWKPIGYTDYCVCNFLHVCALSCMCVSALCEPAMPFFIARQTSVYEWMHVNM